MEIKIIDNDGVRLDKYLMEKLDISRSKVQKLIDNEISLLTPIENCQVPPEELSYLQNYCKDWNLPLQSTFEHPHPNVDWAHVYGQKKV